MTSPSRSVGSFHDANEDISLSEKSNSYDFDSGSEISEAYSYRSPNTQPETAMSYTYYLMQQLCGLRRLFTLLIPAFTSKPIPLSNSNLNQEKVHPTAYLDGMRGLAAFAVFLCHLSYSTWDITHTYGAGVPGLPSENKYLLQLPIVRLIYSGPPMVAIFFVISGYALSYKPLKQMRSRDFEGFANTLTSAIFRRPLRLFLPCFASTLIVVCLTRLGLYKLTEDFALDMRAVHEDHYWTAPDLMTQLCDWVRKMLDFINVFDWSLYAGSTDLDRHLWTIPVEFRCSLGLFLTQIFVAKMVPRTRLSALAALILWGTYWNRWEMVPFWAGIVIAELDLIKIAKNELPMSEKGTFNQLGSRCRSFWRTLFDTAIFVTGLFFASYPDAEGHISPGYVHLTRLIPERYTEKHRFWPTIGAVMIVWSTSNLSFLKRVFTTRFIQYLGKISFPLYVCHGFVIHTFGYMMMDGVWDATNAWDDRGRLEKGFAVAALCTIAVTVWVSDVFLHMVDNRSVRFSRWLESKVFA